MLNRLMVATAATALMAVPAAAEWTAEELMMTRLGTTDPGAVIEEAFNRAATPVTEEMRAKALECWTNSRCETGTGGPLTVAYADGFGENVWRQVTKMEFIMQALTYPEVGEIIYSSARGDAATAISDLRTYIARGVDAIVIFADHGEALAPTIREATEAGISVTLHNGTTSGTSGVDYAANIAEDICEMGRAFVRAVQEGNADAENIVALGGTPGNPLSQTWQDCAEETAGEMGMTILSREDTNWTQEGTRLAVTGVLARFDDIHGYIYEYADGFRGAVDAYREAGVPMDIVAALRTDEQGVFCDMGEVDNPNFKIFYSSGQNFQSRIALTAAMMAREGEVPAIIEVPFSMKPGSADMCDPSLPSEMSVSTILDVETLQAMFAN